MAVVMFVTSLMSVAPVLAEDEVSTDCSAVASDVQSTLQKIGYHYTMAHLAANIAYDSCIENGGTPNGI